MLLAITSVVIGCEDSAMHCDGTCIADPAPHCLRDDDSAEVDCPGGLVHGQAAVAGTVCAGPTGAAACRWRPPPIEPFNNLALIDGFKTQPMEMHVAPPPDSAFLWTPPPGTAFVACGIFTCDPVFSRHPPVEPAASQTALYRIANAGACLLTLQVTTASPSSLPIGEQPRPVGADECTTDRVYDRVIDFLAAGCWAYDATALVAASRLVPLRSADLAGFVPDIPTGASCVRDGDACYDDSHAHPFFGACLGGVCEPRCASPEDCEIAGTQLMGMAPTTTCSWECRMLPRSLVGACSPLAR